MNDQNLKSYRLRRHPREEGPSPLSSKQEIIEKLDTGNTGTTATVTSKVKIGKQRWKIMKDTLTVGTWNVQTLWTGKGEISGGDFIWSGEDITHSRGVGMLLFARVKHIPIGYNPISSRVITARFHTTPFKLTVIHEYALTSASSADEIEIFYDSIEHALTQTPKKDIVIVTGDWNAKVGSDNTNWELVMCKCRYGNRNERGDRLLEFATLHNLNICNTRFQQKANRKWTWASPDGVHKSMIDLVLIQRRWKSSATNCRTFQSADISSDHSLVLCNIKLRLRR
ncbi:unnamed protein product [Rotaria socialis]|uniref:Endonuclease/exonuclease/phosphatase domain-containing protein n=2 Tax=Rotaria socialis TaxID=392032 RepID=A0A820GDL4_9BILA|nr:unnamed protein product [Rotaria socialis]CAF4278327.1 unnamed protein product [Rotaria socialis]CAF4529238.1 unnamed protein product [Rotaria socialis]